MTEGNQIKVDRVASLKTIYLFHLTVTTVPYYPIGCSLREGTTEHRLKHRTFTDQYKLVSLDLVIFSETERDVTSHVILEHVQVSLRHRFPYPPVFKVHFGSAMTIQ